MDNERTPRLLKSDLFGAVWLAQDEGQTFIRRDTTQARRWLRFLARRLAAREARALTMLDHIAQVPSLKLWDGAELHRQWLAGAPMQSARPSGRAYYREALRILRLMHREGVVHNDTAKEPNWLVLADGSPALIDFQVAMCFNKRGKLFRMLAREDLRHMLKHKRTYRPDDLSARELRILATPAFSSRLWQASGKKLYLWITRGLLGWADREGADDRRPDG
ncbi:MAG: serine/threonine protein kinase [Gammaproteobacteria bacterium]|nr:serine/threonine protein kinase [Gammaproteobacteria bacterium]MDH3768368.1 serine/threonine protein kinase [Gammaproteobacteria bacterium]